MLRRRLDTLPSAATRRNSSCQPESPPQGRIEGGCGGGASIRCLRQLLDVTVARYSA